MANGQTDTFDVYSATVHWDGNPRRVMVDAADTKPLVGMALLQGYRLVLENIDGGPVTVTSL
jgi:predicted aspartyl protease